MLYCYACHFDIFFFNSKTVSCEFVGLYFMYEDHENLSGNIGILVKVKGLFYSSFQFAITTLQCFGLN